MKVAIATAAALALMVGSVMAQEKPWWPEFTKENTPEQYRAVFPPQAWAEKVSGEVMLNCLAGAKGELVDCKVAEETPVGYGFGEAALRAVVNERIKTRDKKGASIAGRPVTTYIPFLAPGDSNPDWLRKPRAEDVAGLFPIAALDKGVDGGGADIRCSVTVEGFLANCKVLSEKPAGLGFGQAALQLAPQFRMKPKIRGGKPVEGKVSVPIRWAGMAGLRPSRAKREVLINPPWTTAASADDVRQAWPAKSTATSAAVMIRCKLTVSGSLDSCEVASENPRSQGFGRAALGLAKNFSVRLLEDEGKTYAGHSVNIPFRFRKPGEPDTRKVTNPTWINTLSPESVALVFPREATAAGLSEGRGIVDCLVGSDGNLADCKIVGQDPAGLGFGEAAVKAAAYMTMNPWSADGDPLDGLRVTLPIKLVLTGPEPAAAPPSAP